MKFVLATTATLFLVGGLAQAIPLLPGTDVPSTPATIAPGQETLLADVVNAPWSTIQGTSGSIGTYSTAVYADSVTGGLDFVYQFTNTGTGSFTTDLSETTSQNFGAFTTGVNYVTQPTPGLITTLPPGTVFSAGPTLINPPGTTADFRTGDGTAVGFNFDGSGTDIKTGNTSVTLIVFTNATQFTTGVIGITAGPTVNVAGFEPIVGTSVPEPAMILPAGAALLGLLAFRRKAQSKA